MIRIKSKTSLDGILFPTSLNEITPEVLDIISKDVHLPKYYCIVALAFETKLFDFATTIKNPKNTTVGVTPILCKLSEELAEEYATKENQIYKVGNKVIIDRSSLERGVHLNLKTIISSTAAHRFFEKDSNLVKDILANKETIAVDCRTGKELTTKDVNNIVILEFKVVPINDIVATIPISCQHIDPFIAKELN